MQDTAESQPIAGVFVPRLVARLHREGFEGTLRFHAGGGTRVVYYRRGDIASAASNADGDRLHNILIREGRLTVPQVEMARSRLRAGTTLGKTLIELGFLTPSELLQGARRQVRQILAACFALTEGSYQIASGQLPNEVTNLGLPARRLIFDALMEAGDRQAIVREMGSMESVYRPAGGFAEALAALRLDPEMEQVARLIDGTATLREMSGRTSLDDFTVSKIVLALDILGLAEMTSSVDAVQATIAAAPETRRSGRRIPVETEDFSGASVAVVPSGAPEIAPPAEEPPAPLPAAPLPAAPLPAKPFTSVAPVADAAVPAGSGGPPSAPWGAPVPAATPYETTEAFRSASPGAERGAAPEEPAAGDATLALSSAEEAPAIPTEAAEPPRFSRDELPAFASPEAEPEGWSVDPETGERMLRGPVEMTFDGPVMPEPVRAGTPGRYTAIAVAAAIVVAAVALAVYFRGAPDEVPVRTRATPADAAPADGVTAQPTAAASARPTAAESSEKAAAEPESPPPGPAPETMPAGARPAEAQVPVQPPAPAPQAAAPPSPAPSASAPSTGAAAPAAVRGLEPGQRLIDAGDVDRAAASFAHAVEAEPRDAVTLQVLIACAPESVIKARVATRPDGPLFVLPFTLQGRSCWRVLWGVYADRDAANAAAAGLPAYFVAAGVKPVVVSLGRLRAPA